MRRGIPAAAAVVLVALALVGCVSAPKRVVSRDVPVYATLANGNDPLNPAQRASVEDPAVIEQGAIPYYEAKRGHALNVLTISGGGQNGAFGAGFLKGWRESGTRPEFDIVTGVSTGALLASHTLLGTPADDEALEEIYTGITSANIYRKKWVLGLLFGADSLLDTAPLAALIAKYITPETLGRVAAAYDDNRRLFVGTTNLDYDQTWVWDMTQIAKKGDIDLYRKVLLASASFPIAFPPQEIHGHLFGDGSARANIIVTGLSGDKRPGPPLHGPGNVFVLENGRLRHPPVAMADDVAGIAGESVGAMMTSSMEYLLLMAFLSAQNHGYNFNLVHIPANVDIGKNPLAFDAQEMRGMFDAGRELGRQADPWAHRPPSLGDIPRWLKDSLVNR